MIQRITAVAPLGGYRLRLAFADGFEREVDLSQSLRGPMFEALNDPDFFRRIRVDPESRTITWPNGVDLDPDVLRGTHEAAGAAAPASRL